MEGRDHRLLRRSLVERQTGHSDELARTPPLNIRTASAVDPFVPKGACDANALDRDGTSRDLLVAAFMILARNGCLSLFAPSGVVAETLHPHAPADVKAAVRAAATAPAPRHLTAAQHIDRIRVRAIMRGDGRPGKHDADASHLSEAAEAGCTHFITQDGKILRRRDTLRRALPPCFAVQTLAEFMAGTTPSRDGRGLS